MGETFLRFEQRVAPSELAAAQLREDALAILGKASFQLEAPSRSTGLVVGHVQSGKTMSFEAVIALARDNGFALIVVVTGISNPLLDQSVKRLRSDLKNASPNGWHFVVNPSSTDPQDLQLFNSIREDWTDEDTPAEFRNPIVAVVLKNYSRIQHLIDLVGGQNWAKLPVLIIDDEADQASLNNRVQRGESSTTHTQLTWLRNRFPNHAYLQYTATPQAPLLIHLSNVLSPDFVKVLTPGAGYVGGEQFFVRHPELIETIPNSDIVSENGTREDPPESLLAAMRIYFLGLAYALSLDSAAGPRSMLVHPSRGTTLHGRFITWVTQARKSWQEIFAAGADAQEDLDALIEDFQIAHDDLSETVGDLPPLDDLLKFLRFAIRKTHIVEMNTRDGGAVPEIKWEDALGFILVGGQALDRGFTVEGLTVTYMPRGIGVGNVDTLQQRARFFGYKESYLQLCRIYLEADVRVAFEHYVDHESDMHSRLIEIEESGQSLNDWQRVFYLDASLSPTRAAVLSSGYVKGNFSDAWSIDLRPSLVPNEMSHNWAAIEAVISDLDFVDFGGHPDRTPAQTHTRAETTVERAFEMLRGQILSDQDSGLQRVGLLLQLARAVESDPGAACTLVRMRPNVTEERSLEDGGAAIKALFQGPSRAARGFAEGDVYPGDAAIKDLDRLTIQIHDVQVRSGTDTTPHVPVLAIWVPSTMGAGWYVQQTH